MPDAAQQLELYRLLVDKSLGLMCIHDLDGVLLALNPAVGRSLGYPPGVGVGRNLKEFLAPEVRPLFDDYVRKIREEGFHAGLMRLVASDGSERIWSYRNILHREPGQPPIVLGHALDVTEQARAEQALRESRRELAKAHEEMAQRVVQRTAELEEANSRLVAEIAQRKAVEEELLRARKLESLGVLAGGIAHDFNNFLTVIQGNIALTMMEAPPGSPLLESLEQAEAACRRAATLANQLLTFAKGGAPVRKPRSVARLLEEVVELASAGSPAGVRLWVAADLSPAEIDAAQMSQVLHNILLNARQAMPEGGTIDVEAENAEAPPPLAGRCVRIRVRDRGCGIPAEVLPKIFDPYFSTREGGTGLGLATAYAIVRKHQGLIDIESQVNGGTTVTIYLPACEGAEEPEPRPSTAPRAGSGRILVMDDDPHIRRVLTEMLGQLGYSAESAPSGVEAIDKYREARDSATPFDAAILDLTISGGMGGRQTAERLKQIDPSAKLILSSGYSDDAIIAEYRRHGFEEVLLKPWTPEQLSETLRRVLG